MLAIIAKITIKPGSESEFEAIASELAAKVNANEPGCQLYVCAKAAAPQTYFFLERYDDEAAIAAHRASDHFKEMGKKMGAHMAAPPEIERLSEI
jgi:quinol monooxygenase YgiN